MKLEEIPSSSEMQLTLQKRWGFKFQVAAEPLLEEMGYRIVRTQHRPLTTISKLGSTLKQYRKKIGDYLWYYADYVVEEARISVPSRRKKPRLYPTPERRERRALYTGHNLLHAARERTVSNIESARPSLPNPLQLGWRVSKIQSR